MSIVEKISSIWKLKDLRNKILFVFVMLVIFRFAAHIPIPGVDVENLKNFFSQSQFLGLLNVFSGGALSNFSVVLLGVAPYITASIIFQLLTMIVPRLQEISKDGEAGQKKITQWTRYLTIPLAIMQSYATITLLQKTGQGIIGDLPFIDLLTAVITITGGCVFLMWIGEVISEKKIGNGISLIIFAGIIAGIPTIIQQSAATFDPSKIPGMAVFLAIGLITVVGVVIISEARRNIPVNYARQIRGNRMYGGTSTHLPLKVNQAGVIPIIFAISLVLMPPLVAQYFAGSGVVWIASLANFVNDLFSNPYFYSAFYFILVVAFTYFYTAVIFKPDEIAENLQKQGGFIPGIRPGQPTAQYLQNTSQRILLTGALFLGIIAVMPYALQSVGSMQTMVIGGTSLLIVVSVVIETVKQVETQLIMRDYEGF